MSLYLKHGLRSIATGKDAGARLSRKDMMEYAQDALDHMEWDERREKEDKLHTMLADLKVDLRTHQHDSVKEEVA